MADAETKEELKKLKEEKKAFKNDQKKAKAEDRANQKAFGNFEYPCFPPGSSPFLRKRLPGFG